MDYCAVKLKGDEMNEKSIIIFNGINEFYVIFMRKRK